MANSDKGGANAGPITEKTLLATLSRLSPDTDRRELTATVDSATSQVVRQLKAHKRGTPLPDDIQRLANVTLHFLQACSNFRDAMFTLLVKRRAHELSAAMEDALSVPEEKPAPKKKAAKAPPKDDDATDDTEESSATPQPEQAATSAPAPPPNAGKGAAATANVSPAFSKVFTDTLCVYLRRKIEAFEVVATSDDKLPFILAPAFSLVFERAVRESIIPDILEGRRIKLLSQSILLDDTAPSALTEVFSSPANGNVVRSMWNGQLGNFRTALSNKQAPAKQQAAAKAAKTGWLNKLVGKKEAAPPPRKLNDDVAKKARQFWSIIVDGAKEGNYDPPKKADLAVFQNLFEFDTESIIESREGARQVLNQETRLATAQNGSACQYLCELGRSLPAHCGELIALWAFYTHRDDFTDSILKAFLTSYGTTPAERRKKLPLFTRWVSDVGKARDDKN
jgi:hypothetical protein